MDLWIRSQDKINLVKIHEVFIIKSEVYENTHFIRSSDFCLGRYSTEERALEVLDEIQNKISEYQMVDIGCHSEFICNNIVYEMPKE